MTGEEGGGGGGGGGGVGVSGGSVSAMCLVCGTNQANLTHHLSLHTKEEIIRAVTHSRPGPEVAVAPSRPLPEVANRRMSRPRKVFLQPPPVRPATTQPHLVLGGTQAQQSPTVTATVAPTPQVVPAPQPPAASQPVRLSPIAPLIQPSRSGVPLTPSPVQATPPAPAGNYLLIGNNMFPAGSVISNNLQLGSSGMSYIIPSSGGLVLAAAPQNNQTLLVQPPSVAPPQPMQVKQSLPPPPMATTLPTTIYNSVACRPARPVQPDGPTCMFEGPAAPVQSEAHTTPADPLQQESESHRATISIGKNISISLPRELVSQKEKLKDIINQELVRALLMNEVKKGRSTDPAQPHPSTSTSTSISTSTSGTTRTVYYPAKMEDEEVENMCHEMCQDDDTSLDEDVHYCGATQDRDPLASDPLSGTPRSGRSPDGSIVDSNISSPDHTLTMDPGMHGGFITPDVVTPYRTEAPVEAMFSQRSHSGPSPPLIMAHAEEGCERATVRPHYIIPNGHDTEEDGNTKKVSEAMDQEAIVNNSHTVAQGEGGHPPHPPITATGGSQAIKRDQIGNGEEQPITFLTADRTLNSLLGSGGLQEMVYVEEQVLGAVEQVFSGSPSVTTTTTATTMPSTSTSEAADHRLLQRRLVHPYPADTGDPLAQLPAPPYRDTTQDNEHHDVKCKYEVQGPASQPPSTVGEMVAAAAAAGVAAAATAAAAAAASSYNPEDKDNTQDKKQDVKCKFEEGRSSSQLSSNMDHGANGTTTTYTSHQHHHSTLDLDKEEIMIHKDIDVEEEEVVDDPSLVVDSLAGGTIFPDDHMFEQEMAGQQSEEVMSLKASETLADSDSERATPHEELSDVRIQIFSYLHLSN